MRFTVDSIAEIGKSLAAKREKRDDAAGDKQEIITCTLKLTELQITREHVDQLCGALMGARLWGDDGIPVVHCEIALTNPGRVEFTGHIGGKEARLPLMQAQVRDIVVTPCAMAALMACTLRWEARGDEVEDITDVLGRLCNIEGAFSDGQQLGLFDVPLADGITSMEIRDADGNVVVRKERRAA